MVQLGTPSEASQLLQALKVVHEVQAMLSHKRGSCFEQLLLKWIKPHRCCSCSHTMTTFNLAPQQCIDTYAVIRAWFAAARGAVVCLLSAI